MNKIIDVDVDGAYALVEPGVTLFGLHNYLVETSLTLEVGVCSGTLSREV